MKLSSFVIYRWTLSSDKDGQRVSILMFGWEIMRESKECIFSNDTWGIPSSLIVTDMSGSFLGNCITYTMIIWGFVTNKNILVKDMTHFRK